MPCLRMLSDEPLPNLLITAVVVTMIQSSWVSVSKLANVELRVNSMTTLIESFARLGWTRKRVKMKWMSFPSFSLCLDEAFLFLVFV